MRITKDYCRKARGKLLDRLSELCLMSDKQLKVEAERVATFKMHEPTRNDLIHWCMKWAIHDALPSSVLDY